MKGVIMSNEMESKLYSMKLHEVIQLKDGSEVMRVLTGWIYSIYCERQGKLSSVFVPKKVGV